MPIIKSAKKRVKIAAKANVRNSKTRRKLRDTLKEFARALTSGKAVEIAKAQKAAESAIDTAAKKNVIHKNKAARQKAKFAAQIAKDSGSGEYPIRKAAGLATKLSENKISSLINEMFEIDFRSKTSNLNLDEALKTYITTI